MVTGRVLRLNLAKGNILARVRWSVQGVGLGINHEDSRPPRLLSYGRHDQQHQRRDDDADPDVVQAIPLPDL